MSTVRHSGLRPQNSVEYVVNDSDTLERIAAKYDCTPSELMKLNRLHSRMVFSGQKIYVPGAGDEDSCFEAASDKAWSRPNSLQSELRDTGLNNQHAQVHQSNTFTPPEPLSAQHSRRSASNSTASKDKEKVSSPEKELDAECLQRFLKLNVKHFTDSEGTVPGTLLVTPNCMMFDPDLTHPLVKENGPDKYMMIAKMGHLISVALYKDISAMTHEKPICKDHIYGQEDSDARRSSKEIFTLTEVVSASEEVMDDSDKKPTGASEKVEKNHKLLVRSAPPELPPTVPADLGPPLRLENIPEVVEHEVDLLQLLEAPVNHQKRHLSESDVTTEDESSAGGESQLNLLSVPSQENDFYSCPSSIERDLDQIERWDDTVEGARSGPHLTNASSTQHADKRRKRILSSGQERLTNLRHSLKRSVSAGAQSMARGAQTVGKGLTAGAQKGAQSVKSGAQSVGGALTSGAQQMGEAISSGAQTLATGAQSVGGAIVNMPRNIVNISQGGAQQVGDAIASGAQSVGGAIVSMPRNIVNMSSGLFSVDETESDAFEVKDGWFGQGPGSLNVSGGQISESAMRRQKSYAKLAELKAKAQQAREAASAAGELDMKRLRFTCAVSKDEKPDLFTPIEEMLPSFGSHAQSSSEMPYFLCLRINSRKRKMETAREFQYGDHSKAEYWFTVPKDRADGVYAFLVQWSPDKYGSEDEEFVDTGAVGVAARDHTVGVGGGSGELATHEGFVIIDSEEEDRHLTSHDNAALLHGGLNLNREWEIITIEECKRRLSLLDLDPSKFPLPEGAATSTILDEEQIRQIIRILPARAEGYPWVLVYSTLQHGFSLKTLYRNMNQWGEEMSPTLLVVKDTTNQIFGTIVNCPIVPKDHFYGNGESLLFTFYPEFQDFRWTGENNFFIKGHLESLAIGASHGHNGLWFDEDLYHGRTESCLTFDNPPLTSKEDFLIAAVEAWGFSMGT